MPTEKCVFCLNRLNNWEDWEASSNTPLQQGSHNWMFTTKMCKVSEWPSNHSWGSTSLMIMGIIITKWLWHIQAITLQKGNYSTQELTPSRKWLQSRQAPQHSLCMTAITAELCWLIMKYLLCTIPSTEALGQLLIGTTTSSLSHPQVHGYSWSADKLDRMALVCTIIAQTFCKASLVLSPAIFPNPEHHRKLAFET